MISKSRVTHLFLALLLLCVSFAQNATTNITTNIGQLLDTANKIRTSDPTKFSALLTELEEKSAQLTKQQSYFFNYLQAYKLTFNGKSQEALPLFQNILAANDANIIIKFRARLTIINIFAIEQNWAEGLSYLSVLLKELPKIKDLDIHSNGLMVTAIFYNQLGQYTLGLKYAELLLNSASEKRTRCFATTIIIESKLHLKRLQNNDDAVQEAIQLCDNEAIPANFIRSHSAKFSLENNKPDHVINSLSPHLTQIEATKYPRLIVEIYTSLAEAYWLQGDLDNTQNFAFKAKLVGESMKTTQAVVAAYKLLYQVAKKRNKFQIALMYNEIYSKLDKTYINETQTKHLAFQLAEHKELEQKNHIEFLNKKNALLTAEQALIKANAENTRFIMIILMMTLAVLTFWGYRLLKAHKRIKQLAEYDSLTRVFNRGHFTQVANNALRFCQSAEQELSIIMFDLDNFKKINDSYGHACGDWALKKTVNVCKSIGRQNDIFTRLGGEEFCILLTSCDKQSAMIRAEACRLAIEEICTTESGFDFTITASFGVTDAKTSSYKLEKLLADVDSATYASKHAGRNQVTVFKQPESNKKVVQLDDSRNTF